MGDYGAAAVAASVGVLGTWAILSRFLPRLGPTVENYRGRAVVSGAGVVLLAPLLAAGVWAWTRAAAAGADRRRAVAILVAGAGMGLLGALDDRYGSGDKGLRGHLRALAERRVTTGFVKLAGGLVLGAAASLILHADLAASASAPMGLSAADLPGLARDAMLIALAANMGNLLDLRPGRAAKVWVVCMALVAAARPPSTILVAGAGLFGGVAAWLPYDLGERAMLGDAGANLLGAVAGVAAAVVLSPGGRWILAAILLVLTAASERVSFSKVIAATPPLRVLDELGTRRSD